MLLIFGFRIRLRTIGSVAFFCPNCGGDRTASRCMARRWFTLFWLPVIPLNQVGEVVECETCHTKFDPVVIERATTADLASFLSTAVRVLTAMVVRTGDPENPAMRAAAVNDVAASTAGYDERTLIGDVASIDTSLAEQYVAPLAEGLQMAGKERFMADLVGVALAAGTITSDQRHVLDVAGRGLGLTPAHITGIVSSVAASSTPPATEPPLGG
ncbi:MAG: hypothetical protein ABIP03_11490 [Aquihabitans sp.]